MLKAYPSEGSVQKDVQMTLAQIEARLGDVDSAITLVTHLLEVPRGMGVVDLQYSPFWDPLRKNPRFAALLKNPPSVRY